MKILLTPVEYKYLIQASDTVQNDSEKLLNDYIEASEGLLSKKTTSDKDGTKYISLEVSSDYFEEYMELFYTYSTIIIPSVKGVVNAVGAMMKDGTQLATKWLSRYKKANKNGQSEKPSANK